MSRHWNGYTQCRIGETKNLARRAISENADSAWELMRGGKVEIRILESIISARFGLPQEVWVGPTEFTQLVLDAIWGQIEDNWSNGRAAILHAGGNPLNKPSWENNWKEKSLLMQEKRNAERWARWCDRDSCKQLKHCYLHDPHGSSVMKKCTVPQDLVAMELFR
jgi:hypothetical protein